MRDEFMINGHLWRLCRDRAGVWACSDGERLRSLDDWCRIYADALPAAMLD